MKAKLVNELMGHPEMEKDIHAEYEKVKELLLSIDVSEKIPEEIYDILNNEIDDRGFWANLFKESYVDPIVEALNLINTKLEELENIKEVGDIYVFNEMPKGSKWDQIKKIVKK